ncbi:hypothetical protein IGS74_12835 [Aureimonas sp. OT7]|uniref:DUF6886 family protein n=1 Tax=Aureimonas sp. OT7 TaxID=2816454 RepID=UPI00178652AC|nr:DUF6886 family protein [Aureimonas sp. OT7]QOG05490.1 hypothetical protein IGS74_12835 [Aureimonas sp. OT7]
MQLFHFSDRRDIEVFVPRPVAVPPRRPAGMDWLNGPLVWAIDDWHQPLYLFPRDCPRILLWPTNATTPEDRRAHWTTSCRMIAYIEWRWFTRLAGGVLYRYTLPSEGFESLNDAGMWVCRSAARPAEVQEITNIGTALAEADVELRVVPTLEPLKSLWNTSHHVSGIRLRNAGAIHLP